MKHLTQLKQIIILLALISILDGCVKKPVAVIYIDQNGDKTEELAAREIRKYVYQRTGELVPVEIFKKSGRIKGDAILVGNVSTGMMTSTGYSFPVSGQDAFIKDTHFS